MGMLTTPLDPAWRGPFSARRTVRAGLRLIAVTLGLLLAVDLGCRAFFSIRQWTSTLDERVNADTYAGAT